MPRNAEDMFAEAIMEGLLQGAIKSKGSNKTKEEAIKDLAKTNKTIFDEHIKVGFIEDQAMKLTIAFVNHK